jgi:hypothetical protein
MSAGDPRRGFESSSHDPEEQERRENVHSDVEQVVGGHVEPAQRVIECEGKIDDGTTGHG